MGSFSVFHWGIVLVIVMLVFGTRKLKHIGADLGSAVHGFQRGIRGDEAAPAIEALPREGRGEPAADER